MTTEHSILTLAQWLSPSFPVGAYAYSHGLETDIQKGTVKNADDLQIWVSDVLEHGSGRNDSILLHVAHACTDRAELTHINQTALAFAASHERRKEMQLQGSAFCQTTAEIWGADPQELVYPIAVGAAAAYKQIDPTLTAAMYLQAFTTNLVSAAMRAVPLGQIDGQRVIATLNPLCDRLAKETARLSLDDLHSNTFLSDIAAMKHETLQPRIFRT